MRYVEVRRHSIRIKPGDRLSQAGVDLARRVGQSMGPFQRVITSTLPRAYETAIAMGFAVDEQLEGLCLMDSAVETEVSWDAGFLAFAEAVRLNGAAAAFAHKQADFWRAVAEALPGGGAALLVTHGGFIESGAVVSLPQTDHRAWGRACSWCEGMRLSFEAGKFVDAHILRVNPEAA